MHFSTFNCKHKGRAGEYTSVAGSLINIGSFVGGITFSTVLGNLSTSTGDRAIQSNLGLLAWAAVLLLQGVLCALCVQIQLRRIEDSDAPTLREANTSKIMLALSGVFEACGVILLFIFLVAWSTSAGTSAAWVRAVQASGGFGVAVTALCIAGLSWNAGVASLQ